MCYSLWVTFIQKEINGKTLIDFRGAKAIPFVVLMV